MPENVTTDPPIHIERTLSNRAVFDSTVYTSLPDAIQELQTRSTNASIFSYVTHMLPAGIPEAMRGKKSLVLFRHIATSNYEERRFMAVADSFPELSPFILEYTSDVFNDRNENKYFLGKIPFHKGVNKKGEPIIENIRVIDFNKSNNKPLASLSTVWGESLVHLHHDLFLRSFPNHAASLVDISDWLHTFGATAKDFYKAFFTLFLKDAILFENFFIDQKEFSFTKDVILPAIAEITKETGYKPLIVALAPTQVEGDTFWNSHPYLEKGLVEEKSHAVSV